MDVFFDCYVALAKVAEHDEGIFHVYHFLLKFFLLKHCLRLIHKLSLHYTFLIIIVIKSIRIIIQFPIIYLLLATFQIAGNRNSTLFNKSAKLHQKQVIIIFFDKVK